MNKEMTTGEARVNAYRHRVISYYTSGNELHLNEAKNIGDNLVHCVNLYDKLVGALERVRDTLRLVENEPVEHTLGIVDAVLAKTKETK